MAVLFWIALALGLIAALIFFFGLWASDEGRLADVRLGGLPFVVLGGALGCIDVVLWLIYAVIK